MTNIVNSGPAQPVFVVNPATPANGGGGQVEITGQPIATTAQATIVNTDPIPVAGVDGPLALDATAQAIVDAIVTRLPLLAAGRVPVALDGAQAVSGPLTDAQLRATPVVILDPIAYFASAAGGRVAFNIATAVIPLSGTGEQPLAALINPADSGKDMVLDLGEFGTSVNATFRRYRNATITPTGAPRTPTNTGGGAATSAALMYVGGTGATYTRTGGTIAKDAFIQAFTTYFTQLRGRSVLRPGQSLSWTIQPTTGGAFTASVYLEYYERPAEA